MFKGNLLRAYDSIANIHSSSGNKAAALEIHLKSLAVSQDLEKNSPTNENRRDLALAYLFVGRDLCDSGKVADGLLRYRQALPIFTELARANPTNAQSQRDLSVVYRFIGDAQFTMGDLPAAQESFQEDMKTTVSLAQADPQNALARRDLAYAREGLSKVLTAKGD